MEPSIGKIHKWKMFYCYVWFPEPEMKVLRKLRCLRSAKITMGWPSRNHPGSWVPISQPGWSSPGEIHEVYGGTASGPLGLCENGPQNFMVDHHLVDGLEHEFYDFPYIGNNHPNWLSNCSGGLKPPTRSCSLVKDHTGVRTLFSDCPNLRFWRQPSAAFARGALLTFLTLFEMGAGSYNDLVLLERTNVNPINKGYYFEWF